MKTLFWNVDTQNDFMKSNGKLSVPDAMGIAPNLEKLTQFARDNNYKIVNTADWHYKDSKELSANPDFKTTFPEHCMAGTVGAEYISETMPVNPYVVDWNGSGFDKKKLENSKEIVLYKDAFSIFEGNKFSDEILEALNPDKVIVYGVATNVCIDQAILGLLARHKDVYVVEDAIKELLGSDLEKIISGWEGVNRAKTEDIIKYLNW